MIEIANKRITRVDQLGPAYTANDGIGIFDGHEYLVHDCIIDLSGVDAGDEVVAVTWGSSAIFRRCVIRGGGKLCLCGSGDNDKRNVEDGKTVTFTDCIFENFGRRGPEVQSGMSVTMHNCLIRNWGDPDFFSVRNFAAWAHDEGELRVERCVFWQESFLRPIGQFFKDIANHIGEAVNDSGLIALLYPSTYIPGVCRGLMESDGGSVSAEKCYKNHWWIRLQNAKNGMSKDEAQELIATLESMANALDRDLPR